MQAPPESFSSEVQMNEFGTDEYSSLHLCYPGGRTADSVQTIGQELERNAVTVSYTHLSPTSLPP